MSVELKMRNGLFFARCTLNADTNIEMWGIVDSGSRTTFLTSAICDRAGLKYKGKLKNIVCSHGKSHRNLEVPTYRSTITLGNVTVKCTSPAYDGRLMAGEINADAILGTNILCNFDGRLNWSAGTGSLEQMG
ncbi:MAG: hypothetical protein EB824_02570 [Thaumarchaeota archaeon S15]|nr:MAG: hypothetical protein EB824_02570 [Thaumarchaeota archaeon S15]